MKVKIIPIILLISLFVACDNSKVVTDIWDDGCKVVKYYDDKRDTSNYTREFYYSNGQLGTKGFFRKGEMDGQWKWWYENGQLKDKAYLENGLYVNERLHFNEDGDTTLIEIIQTPCFGDCCHGQVIYFKNNRRIMIYHQNKNGDRDGICYYLKKSGDTAAIFNYVNGTSQGLRIEFQDNGLVSAYGEYKDGFENGEWVFFDSIGVPTSIYTYTEGEILDSLKIEKIYHEFQLMNNSESKLEYYEKIKKSRYKK